MNALRWIGSAAKAFFGIGGSSAGPSPVQKLAEIADEYKYTEQEQAEAGERGEDRFDKRAAQDSADTARIMTAVERPGVSLFDTLVDAFSRLQRPAWGLYFFGGFVGWWKFPDLTTMAQFTFWSTIFTIYFTALFGGRALFKDLSGAIAKILEAKK